MSESKLEHAYLNLLQLNISMHNLQPVLYMSPMLLTTKIYWIIIGDLFLYWSYIKIWFSSDTVRGLKGYFHIFWLLKKTYRLTKIKGTAKSTELTRIFLIF